MLSSVNARVLLMSPTHELKRIVSILVQHVISKLSYTQELKLT